MKKVSMFFFAGFLLLLYSCADVYYSPEAKSRAMSHQLIAVAPPKVSIAARKKVDAEAIKEQQKTESLNFQKEMCTWLLKRKMQNRITVEVLDVETTNAKLRKAGYFEENTLSPSELCEVLGVDAILTSNYALSKPMSDGAALAVGVLLGAWGATNTTDVTMEIHDKETKKLLWNYSHRASGSVGSSPAQLVDYLMRNASKKMPYTR